jgi:branched-chain amino acid transport system substrate-binding protein
LGVSGRNGAEMAVAEINQHGGINGVPLELLALDDKGDPETARQNDQQLIDQGVVAIIGHTTSEQTAAVLELINQREVILLSPTSSSVSFSQKKDFFFRVMPSNDKIGEGLAEYIYQSGISEILGIYETNNRSFSQTQWQAIQQRFRALGGEASREEAYQSGATDLLALMQRVKRQEPQAIVFIAPAVDAALMAQYGVKVGLQTRYFSSSWANTQELIQKGGRAVDGMILVANYYTHYPSPHAADFNQKFEERYGKTPSLGASHSYEAVMVLAEALKHTNGSRNGLAEALQNVQNLPGIQDPISFDEFGDVEREIFIVQIRDGKFVLIATLPPSP